MIQNIYAIKDTKLGAFTNIFIAENNAIALRQFGDVANNQNTAINKHPDDYELWNVGTWDDETGKPNEAVQTVSLTNAKDLINGSSEIA